MNPILLLKFNKQQMSAFTSALCAYFSLQILQFVLVGTQNFLPRTQGTWCRYAADYGTSTKFQKYDVIDFVVGFPPNHSNYSLKTTTTCYSGRFTIKKKTVKLSIQKSSSGSVRIFLFSLYNV